MASDKEYLDYILDSLSLAKGITCRAMMGEYILYVHERIFGGIYDNRLLIKDTKAAREMLADAELQKPYEGAKEMLLVTETDDREFMAELIKKIFPELPEHKAKGKEKFPKKTVAK